MKHYLGTWDEGSAPPGSGPTQKFEGPWFSTQLTLSLVIGVTSFLIFCILRTRWEIVYMGRTKLKDFSPAPAHSPDTQGVSGARRFFGWIIPTLRTSEFTVLQTVGLDAAVLLNFYRMSFILFSLLAVLATLVLMPINIFRNGSTDSEPDYPGNDRNDTIIDSYLAFLNRTTTITLPHNGTRAEPSFYDLIIDPQTSATLHLAFAYLFTGICLALFHRNFHRFVLSRQAFALHLIHSISSRTVLVTALPPHLRGDRALAEYFENCGWNVESVSVVREVEALRRALDKRTNALLKLERAWTEWVGNPTNVEGYDPGVYGKPRSTETMLIPDIDERPSSDTSPAEGDLERQPLLHQQIHTERPRPTLRPRWLGAKVDAIEHWERKFRLADEEVKAMRKTGRFEATHVAFVTFENVKDAQTACQVVHYPHHSQVVSELAPEPRDIVWSKVGMSKREAQLRDVVVMGVMTLLLLFWSAPVTSLAGLLSYQEIKKVAPWLAKWIDASPRLGAIVQNSLPSLALISFNGVLPFFLEWLSYEQGYKSRSGTEYSLMRKYYLFLLISVLFIFLVTTTYLAIVRDLADTPMKIPEKLANGLQGSNARNFMVSYVMLQALGLMPLQLLNLGPLVSLAWARAFFTKTPREYAEANAPPMLNYGWVYPQALLIFTITLVYSVVSPLILIFGATYFGIGYLVYKYKLLFIYFKPYESNGEAWRITFSRLLLALVIFQLFMTGLFSLRGSYVLTGMMAPLILYTLWWSWTMYRDFGPLSNFVALSSICEVERGEVAEHVVGVQEEDIPTRSQSNLNHRRYAMNDETLYVAPSDKRTDYSQPPMNSFYRGVLNTGRRRYAHPALSGSLPTPWLPAKSKPPAFGENAAARRGVVLSLRRKMAKKLRKATNGDGDEVDGLGEREGEDGSIPEGWATGAQLGLSRRSSGEGSGQQASSSNIGGSQLSTVSNPWGDPTPTLRSSGAGITKRLSFDAATGVIAMPEDNVWVNDESDAEDAGGGDDNGEPSASPSTYFHRPNRRRTSSSTNRLMNGNNAPPTFPSQ